jgi:Flp pilus assembly pilin Flp
MIQVLQYVLNSGGIRLSDEEGQGLIEYVLIAGFISVIAIVAIQLVGGNVSALWDSVSSATTIP